MLIDTTQKRPTKELAKRSDTKGSGCGVKSKNIVLLLTPQKQKKTQKKYIKKQKKITKKLLTP